MDPKQLVGEEVAKLVASGMVVGVGTGSTVDAAVEALGARIRREKLSIAVVPSSYETALLCERAGLSVLSPLYSGEITFGFDGADEVDERLRIIKGRGGAILKEKILVSRVNKFIAVVDDTKLVKRLGERFPVPVEVIPEAAHYVQSVLPKLGAVEVVLRQAQGKHGAVITEAGNMILDVRFPEISDGLESSIKQIVGVVENGLFLTQAAEVLVATRDGVRRIVRPA